MRWEGIFGPLFVLIYIFMKGHGELCVVDTIVFTLAFTKPDSSIQCCDL